jgi:hypothetical protein
VRDEQWRSLRPRPSARMGPRAALRRDAREGGMVVVPSADHRRSHRGRAGVSYSGRQGRDGEPDAQRQRWEGYSDLSAADGRSEQLNVTAQQYQQRYW